ncbi:MAG TPA: PilZ domain-containing protein [Chitinivibrionales bacterium]|nr:PilZ domain-containing protein [Chitinivibrionales bacterium]
MNHRERRKHPRIKKQLRVVLYKKKFLFIWDGRHVAELVDISLGGAQVSTKKPLKLGDRVVMSLQPRAYSPAVHFHGKVVWVKTQYAQDHRYMQAGVEFTTVGSAHRKVLKRLSSGAAPAE